jgi:hypothetical protein
VSSRNERLKLTTFLLLQRFLITFDEEGNLLPATVRVGQVRLDALSSALLELSADFPPPEQAVDVVGQAGKPRTISGFQTHQTPVRLGQTERAELATEEFMSYSHVLEGCEFSLSSASSRKLTSFRSHRRCAEEERGLREGGGEDGYQVIAIEGRPLCF